MGTKAINGQHSDAVPLKTLSGKKGVRHTSGAQSSLHGSTAFERLRMAINRAEPLIEQMLGQIAHFIVCGALVPGDRLPAHIALARRYHIANRTMAQAYLALRRHGMSSNLPSGTFIANDAAEMARRYLFTQESRCLIHRTHATGMAYDEIAAIFLTVLAGVGNPVKTGKEEEPAEDEES